MRDGKCEKVVTAITISIASGSFREYKVECTKHGSCSRGFHSADSAYVNFRCDPANRRFLFTDVFNNHIHMGDMSTLAEIIRSQFEDGIYGYGNFEYRIFEVTIENGAPVLHEIKIESSALEYTPDDWAFPDIWAVRTDTGEKITATSARIDGRA